MGKPDDWLRALKDNGLLDQQPKKTVSAKYLREAAEKRKSEEAHLIAQTYKEQEQYERGCIARMAEASRWAQSLKLGKKFQPIYSKALQLSTGKTLRGASMAMLQGDRGELRCEVVAKDDSHSRIISCELFEREHAKLLHRHRRMLLEEENRAASTASQALQDAGVLLESTELVPGTLKKRRSVRKIMTTGASDQPHLGSQATSRPLVRRDEDAEEGEIEQELRAVLAETQSLTKILDAQVSLLKSNGWNLDLV